MSDQRPPCISGMLIFQPLPSGNELVQVIQNTTDSNITHVGIVRQKENQCVVIEAIGQSVHETPVDEFLNRSNGVVWYKIFKDLSETKAAEMANRAARYLGRPYDFEFRHDNASLYCSELIAFAARDIGLVAFLGVDIPAHWLNLNSASAVRYIKNLGYNGPHDPRLKNVRIITPRDLFYHDGLKDPDFVRDMSSNQPRLARTPEHAVYNTLPGRTAVEKLDYLRRTWGSVKDNIQVSQDSSGGVKRYTFVLGRYSLTLFGQFEDEEKLARLILRELSSGNIPTSPRSPSVPRSRLSDSLDLPR